MSSANWVVTNPIVGVSPIESIDLAPKHTIGAKVRAKHITYGAGEFVYLQGVAGLTSGDFVTYNGNSGATTRWAGVANSGAPLAVAAAPIGAGQYGWFQVDGAAVCNVSGTVAAGDKAYWQATGKVSSTAVNGKQVMGAVAVTANGVPSANQALYTLATPTVQGQTV